MSDLRPGNEAQRLAALRRYAVLDSPPEPAFDRITRLATKYLKAPIALISLVDEDRQWFKSAVGMELRETPRAVAFCAHTILEKDPLVVSDASADPRFRTNPLVTGPPHLKFYAGTGLKSSDGFALGTLSVLDFEPRTLTPDQLDVLVDLGYMAADELELRLAAREREQSESLRDLMFNAVDVGISITDENGLFVEVNPAYCRLFGYEKDELIGKPFASMVLQPRDFARAKRIHDAFFRRWTRSSGEWKVRRKDGKPVTVLLTGHRFQRDGKQFAVATATDLTQLKKVEEQLRQSHKMDAIGRLAGGIAHDFNNLLTIILGYGHILTEELRETPAQATAGEIMRAADRAAALTRQLLAFSRQRPATTECFSLNDVVTEMYPMLERLIGEHIHLKTELAENLADVRAERAQVEQIILNLMINGAMRCPEAGQYALGRACALREWKARTPSRG